MRAVLGTTPQALARRGIALDRLAVLRLGRDAEAETPGAELPLWLGERTHYRASAAIRDTFERRDGALGSGYASLIPAGTEGLVLTGGQVVPAAVTATGRVTGYATVLPRDQWGEITIRTLSAPTDVASVGVGLRWVADTGYLAQAQVLAGIGHATIHRYTASVATGLLDVLTPWRVGDVLRLTAEWDRLRLYRNETLLGDVVDAAPLLGAGQAALFALRTTASELAALGDFVAGPLRQEYVGALADLGDVSASLGFLEPTATPAGWAMSVSNLAPLGGAARFIELWRHGAHVGSDTYDLHRAPVVVLQTVRDGSAPLTVADGRVAHPEAITESLVRLVCAGRDAFLTPRIDPGAVTYLPGPDPVSTPAPVPEDPCGADAPVPDPDPGSVPVEPPLPGPVAEGPEHEGEAGEPPPSPLPGLWFVGFGYEPAGAVEPSVYQYGGPPVPPTFPAPIYPTISRTMCLTGGIDFTEPCQFDQSEAKPSRWLAGWIYRGPDVSGDALIPRAPSTTLVLTRRYSTGGGPGPFAISLDVAAMTVKLARYDASQIFTTADLEALTRYLNPPVTGALQEDLPTRIETLETYALGGGTTTSGSNTAGGPSNGYGIAFLQTQTLASFAASLTLLVGPELIGLEIEGGWALPGAEDGRKAAVMFLGLSGNDPGDPSIDVGWA